MNSPEDTGSFAKTSKSTEDQNLTSNGKISSLKILKLNENFSRFNEEFKILSIDGDNFSSKVFKNLNFDNFPNIFMIVVEIKTKCKFWDLVESNLPVNREFFAQIYSEIEKFSKFLYKAENESDCFEIVLKNSLECSCNAEKTGLKTLDFFEILNCLKKSLIDVHFHDILNHLKVTSESDEKSLTNEFKKSKFLLLFESNLEADTNSELEEKIKELNFREKNEIQLEHIKNIKDDFELILENLLSRCKFSSITLNEMLDEEIMKNDLLEDISLNRDKIEKVKLNHKTHSEFLASIISKLLNHKSEKLIVYGFKLLINYLKHKELKLFRSFVEENFHDRYLKVFELSERLCEELKHENLDFMFLIFSENLSNTSKFIFEILRRGNLNLFNDFVKTLDEKGFNIINAVKNSKIDNLKLILSLDIFDVNLEVNGQTAASIAFNEKNFQILFELLVHNSRFPINFHDEFTNNVCGDLYADKIYIFITQMNEIHSLCNENEIKSKLKVYSKLYPDLKTYHNTSNESLLMKLTKNYLFEFRDELLDTLEWFPLETFENEFLNDENSFLEFKSEDKEFQTENNLKIPPLNFELNYIKILEANAHFIASKDHPKSTYFKIIQEILKFLNKFPLLVDFLKLLAAYNHKKVIYDFSNSRQYPCQDNKKYLNRNEVIFCCEDLLKFPLEIITGQTSIEDYDAKINVSELNSCFASIAHELCHWALQQTYENHCKPYQLENISRRFSFTNVLDNKKLKILFTNFEFENKFLHAEIFSRISQMIIDDSENLSKFQNLLIFLENFILPDVRKASRFIFSIKKVETINEQFGVKEIVQKANYRIKNELLNINLKLAEENILVLTTNFPILTLTAVYQIFSNIEENRKFLNASMTNFLTKKSNNEEKYLIFAEQIQIFIKDYREPLIEGFECCENSILIIYCKKKIGSQKFAEIVKKLNTFKRIIFIAHRDDNFPEFFKVLPQNFQLNSLTDESVERLKQKHIEYFGKIKKIEEVFGDDEINEIFDDLINEENIKICEAVEKVENYVERRLIDLKITEFLDKIKEDKFLILSEKNGSGKTKFFKKLRENLNEKFPTFWTNFVDLKKVENYFDKLLKTMTLDETLQAVGKYLLNLSRIERKIFAAKFKSGKVFLLLDSFDEISTINQKILIKFIVKCESLGKSKIFMIAKHELVDPELKAKILKFSPMSVVEVEEFMSMKNLKIQNRREIAQKLVENSIIGIPLAIKMISESSQYKNSSILFFEKFFTAKISDKSKIENFMKIYELLALEFLFDYQSNFPVKILQEILTQKIISFAKYEKVSFEHQTYAEYFVARFFKNSIFNDNSNSEIILEISEIFCEILTNKKFELTRKFLDEFIGENFKNQENSKELKIVKNKIEFPSIDVEFVKFLLGKLFTSKNTSEILQNLVTEKLQNLLMFASFLIKSDTIVIQKIWIKDKNSIFLDYSNEDDLKLLWNALEILKPKHQKCILADERRNFPQQLVKHGKSVEILENYCKKISANFNLEEIQEIFKSKFLTNENSLFEAIRYENVKAFKFLVDFYKEIKLFDGNYFSKSFIHFMALKEKSSEIYTEVQKVLFPIFTSEKLSDFQCCVENIRTKDPLRKIKILGVINDFREKTLILIRK